jgi:hypothetical protein
MKGRTGKDYQWTKNQLWIRKNWAEKTLVKSRRAIIRKSKFSSLALVEDSRNWGNALRELYAEDLVE